MGIIWDYDQPAKTRMGAVNWLWQRWGPQFQVANQTGSLMPDWPEAARTNTNTHRWMV